VTLLQSEIPAHAHTLRATALPADQPTPQATLTATVSSDNIYAPPANLVPMAPQALALAGGSAPHNNMMPYLTFYFNIALQGVYPPRS
jgi:microcystin-dependent protein